MEVTTRKKKFLEYIVEFAIVLLGITIAFWLSNLGEKAKEARQEEVYLEQLYEDITNDFNALTNAMEFNDLKIAELEKGVEYVAKFHQSLSADSVANYALQCGNYNFFYPKNNSYITLQQSGDLKIIQDQTLKNNFIALYQSYELVKNEQANLIQALDDHFFPFVYESFDLITGNISNPAFFTSVKCTNFLAFTVQQTGQINQLYAYSKRLAGKTADLIQSKLGKLDSIDDATN